MALCDSGCAVALPVPYSNACGVETKPGGINRIGFVKCDYDFTDITDQSEWDAAIAAGDAVWSGLLLGQKPKASFTKKRVNSCSPERVVGADQTVTFQDYNAATVHEADGECTFWNTIQDNPNAYRLVFMTCDDYLYGPIDDFVAEVGDVIEESDSGNRYMDGTLSWSSKSILCGQEVDLAFDQDSSII